jgi:hypothetical protein
MTTTTITARTEAEDARIGDLCRLYENNAVAMAIVDYTGTRDALGLVKKSSELRRRFGARDLRQVEIYQLDVVAYNAAARVKLGL